MGLTPLGRREILLCVGAALLMGGLCALLGVVVHPALEWLGLLPAIFILWVLWFFRDPNRTPPEGEHRLVSPADGVITAVDEMDEPLFIEGPALRISIFMSIFSVHVNRAPLAGRIVHRQHVPGAFVNALRDESAQLNEHLDLGLETDRPEAPRILVRQIAGLIARRIVCVREPGETLARGERFGMIKFGSRLEVFLPADSGFVAHVKPGESVRAGSSVLGEFPA